MILIRSVAVVDSLKINLMFENLEAADSELEEFCAFVTENRKVRDTLC
jgi:hypothetical protein